MNGHYVNLHSFERFFQLYFIFDANSFCNPLESLQDSCCTVNAYTQEVEYLSVPPMFFLGGPIETQKDHPSSSACNAEADQHLCVHIE